MAGMVVEATAAVGAGASIGSVLLPGAGTGIGVALGLFLCPKKS